MKGKGKPLLILHGLLSNSTQTHPILPALKGCKAFFPDFLGCGKSPESASTDIVRENVEQLKKLCSKHKIQTVIGYSIGGLIAIRLQLPNTIFVPAFCTNPLEETILRSLRDKEQTATQMLITYEKPINKFIAALCKNKVPGIKQASMRCAVDYMIASLDDYRLEAGTLKRSLVVRGTKGRLINKRLGEVLASTANAETLFAPENHHSVLRNKIVHAAIARFVRAI